LTATVLPGDKGRAMKTSFAIIGICIIG